MILFVGELGSVKLMLCKSGRCLLRQTFDVTKRICVNMSSGMDLKEVCSGLNRVAPLQLAAKWDNVGLLTEPSQPHFVKKIILTNDLTENVLAESIQENVDLIISYHPPIFSSLKRLVQSKWKDRIVVKAMENRIAIYSPHTACDALRGGVNDWLSLGLGKLSHSEPIIPSDTSEEKSTSDNSWTLCKSNGMGRLCTLSTSIQLSDLINDLKLHLGMEHLRVALGHGKTLKCDVSSVALCAGSGSSILQGVNADVYLTGEMSHHEVLDASSNGVTVILCEHSNSERGYLETYRKQILNALGNENISIVLSKTDRDPIDVI